MKPMGIYFLIVSALITPTPDAWAQNAASPSSAAGDKPAAAPTQSSVTAADIDALKKGLAAAQQQIKALQDELRRRDQAAQGTQANSSGANASSHTAQGQANAEQHDAAAEESDSGDFSPSGGPAAGDPGSSGTTISTQGTPQDSNQNSEQVFNKEMEGPLTIRFRGINVTPGGFAEAAFVRRSRALGADLPTPFNSLTMPGASQSKESDFFGSARQSRPTVYVDGRVGNVDLSSYVSGDFLSAGVTSTATQTNSYTFRLRQVWGQAKFSNGWSFMGGQMWSLVTENKTGIAPSDDTGRTNDSRPMTIDPSYQVGFTFARQYGIRVTKSFNDKVWFAVSIENPQATLTTHGNVNNFLLGELGASNSYNTTATYSFNPSPDIIAKVAFDPGFGHYEIFGLADRISDRVFPCVEFVAPSTLCSAAGATAVTGANNTSREGGGFGANARWSIDHKHIVFGLHGFGGSGMGRYGAGQLSDVTIRGNGTVQLIKDLQGLGTLEWHGKKLDIYSYGGAEYAARSWSFDSIQKAEVGYGAPNFNNTGCFTETAPGSTTVGFTPGSLNHCTGDTRVLIEGTLGFWYRFYAGPRGRFQYGTQFSYVTRNTWSGVGGLAAGSRGIQPNGLDSMVFTSFRYYLP